MTPRTSEASPFGIASAARFHRPGLSGSNHRSALRRLLQPKENTMNRVIFAAASAAALLVASTASAQSATVTINGSVDAKCGVTAGSSTVSLASDLTNSQALVR